MANSNCSGFLERRPSRLLSSRLGLKCNSWTTQYISLSTFFITYILSPCWSICYFRKFFHSLIQTDKIHLHFFCKTFPNLVNDILFNKNASKYYLSFPFQNPKLSKSFLLIFFNCDNLHWFIHKPKFQLALWNTYTFFLSDLPSTSFCFSDLSHPAAPRIISWKCYFDNVTLYLRSWSGLVQTIGGKEHNNDP